MMVLAEFLLPEAGAGTFRRGSAVFRAPSSGTQDPPKASSSLGGEGGIGNVGRLPQMHPAGYTPLLFLSLSRIYRVASLLYRTGGL